MGSLTEFTSIKIESQKIKTELIERKKRTHPFDFDFGFDLHFDSGFSWIWTFSLVESLA